LIRVVCRLRPKRDARRIEPAQREAVKQLGANAQITVKLEDGARMDPPVLGVDIFRIRSDRNIGAAIRRG
jgi:hypothetical protein